MEEIVLKPVGQVLSSTEEPEDMPLGGLEAVIEIFPEYQEALKGIEENSHIWVLSWFHKAPRDVLRVKPGRINPELPEYGVFALRAYWPNTIGILGRLKEKVVACTQPDAIGNPGTDIKPHFENDTIFRPYFLYKKNWNATRNLDKRFWSTTKECHRLAVRMAII